MNNPHGLVLPPPPGPPPGAWAQIGWARSQQGHLPPPPPMTPQQAAAQYNNYNNNNMSYAANAPAPLAIPGPPSQADGPPLVSATYIPGGESFGPGVGIPPLHSQQLGYVPSENQPYNADHLRTYNIEQHPQGSYPAAPPARELPTSYQSQPQQEPHYVPPPSQQNNLSAIDPTPPRLVGYAGSFGPGVAPADVSFMSGHRHTNSDTSVGMLSPADPAIRWNLDRVVTWLAINGFSNDWQEAFKSLKINGNEFLELGRGSGGRGNFGMMHKVIYPQLARECSKSGTGWDQARERDEGKRMRKMIRKIVEGGENPKPLHLNRESGQFLPSASTEGGLENSPNLGRQDGFITTPDTAGGGEESPRKPNGFSSPGPPFGQRMGSRSSTAPVYPTSATPSSHSGSVDGGPTTQSRTIHTRGILYGINDAAAKRHSPSVSSETGVNGIGNEMPKPGFDASPQSGSPSGSYAPFSATGNGALSAPPFGRYGHRKTNSTDSISSNSNAGAIGGVQRRNISGEQEKAGRRHGQEGRRPPTLDIVGKHTNGPEAPQSAKESGRGFLDRLRRRKKDDSAHPSPEDHSLDSPTSPSLVRHMPPSLPFAKNAMNGSSTSLERPASASAMSEHDKNFRDRMTTRPGQGRKYVFVTSDQYNYRLIDITEATSADTIRDGICRSLGIAETDLALIFLTEPGQLEHDEPLSDAMLLLSKNTRADSLGTLKLYVRRAAASAGLAAAPFSAGLGIGLSPRSLNSPPPFGSMTRPSEGESFERFKNNVYRRANGTPTTGGFPEPPAFSDIAARQRYEVLKSAHDKGVLSDDVWEEISTEEFRREEAKSKRSSMDSGKRRDRSPIDLGNSSIKRERVIDFDRGRPSPYEEKKPDPLVPRRRPPPAPAESKTLTKADSLSRRDGASVRTSLVDIGNEKRQSVGDPIAEEVSGRGRRKAVAGPPSVAAGIGQALANAGAMVGVPGASSATKNMSLRDVNGEPQTIKPHRALNSVDFSGTGSRSPGGSPRSPGFTYGKNNMLFKIPDYEEGVPELNGSPAPNPAVVKNPSIERIRQTNSPAVSPNSSPPRRTASNVSRRSYGPSFTFKESDVMFSSQPDQDQDENSDDDSDDGLFALPIAKGNAAKTSGQAPEDDGGGSRRPTLTLNTDPAERGQRTKSVSFQTPVTSTSSDTLELDERGHPIRFRSDKRGSESTAPTSVSSVSPDTDAKLARRQSFAEGGVWANRPPAEDLLDNLDAYFPNLDLDQPVLEDLVSPPASPAPDGQHVGPSKIPFSGSQIAAQRIRSSLYDRVRPTSIAEEPIAEEGTLGSEESTLKSRATATMQSVAQRNVRKSGGLGRMKSIRDVARGAVEGNNRRSMHQSSNAKSGDILRRKSTKMFGANIVQIKPGRGSRVSLIEAVPADMPVGQNSFQIARGQLIGKGSYGRVYLGMNLTTGEMLAVKQVEVNQKAAGQDKERMKDMVSAMDQEIDTMQHLEHSNIVQYLGCERKEFSISIFLEYIPGGSIGSCLRKHGRFDENLVSSMTRQTLSGLAYLHGQGVLHRDLKADNILLDTDGTCKISDFGISKKSDNIYGNDVANTMQGSVFWMAPEVIRSQGQGYSAKVDIWSLGCCVLEMFTGKRPWPKEEAIGAMYKLGSLDQAPPIPSGNEGDNAISPNALAFMLDCFTIDPSERPTAETLLRCHPFCKVDVNYNFLDTELHFMVKEQKETVRYKNSAVGR